LEEIPEIAQEELIEMMTQASNQSFLPFRKHSFGLEGYWIIQHLQKLFCKFFYHSQQPMSAK
jgi:hypothetical protein